jgi:hypothetical protein
MAPSRRSKKRVVDDTEGEKEIKRHRTAAAAAAAAATATATASIQHEGSDSQHAPAPDPVISTTGSNNNNAVVVAVAVSNNNNNNEDKLPSPEKLSEELCTIISDRYSRDDALCTLNRLQKWALTEDPNFLKSFHRYSGVVKLLDFLNKTMKDGNCVGTVRMECIEKTSRVIVSVTYSGENRVNTEIATNIAKSSMECDGIDTLINASEEYNGGDDVPQLYALHCVWCALGNITRKTDVMKVVINKDQAIALFDTGIDIISQLKSVDGDIASGTLRDVFATIHNIVLNDYVTKKYFQDQSILSKCLEVFKKNDIWTCQDEKLLKRAIKFFYCCCRRNLLDESSDYKMLLPLLVMVLNEYPSNSTIRIRAISMINGACSMVDDKKIIERSGAVEVLGALLKSDDINEETKDTVRTLTHTIIAP